MSARSQDIVLLNDMTQRLTVNAWLLGDPKK
ncbi:MAG: hypothetical protein ACI978_002602 [Oleispira sp.]|jgi:hypothetical protein